MLRWMGWPVAAAALAFAPLGAAAAPAVSSAAPAVSTAQGSGVAYVDYRGRGFGRGLGVGLGIGVLGAIIANEAYRPRAGYYYDDYAYNGPYEEPADFAGDPRSLCAQRFRSFEWNTGLFTTFSGEKRVCPYLR
jgi:BA14K-like protein